MAKGSKIALIRAFRCETLENKDGYPCVEITACVIVDNGDISAIDSDLIKRSVATAVSNAVSFRDKGARNEQRRID